MTAVSATDTARDVLEHARAAWCAAAADGNVNAYLGLCTDDVVWLRPGQEAIQGKARLATWIRPTLEAFAYDLRLDVQRSAMSGGWASEIGIFTAEMTERNSGKVSRHRAHYALVWKRERGAWRIDRYADLGPVDETA